jgi:hypothetical protein
MAAGSATPLLCAFNPTGDLFAIVSPDNRLKIWETVSDFEITMRY